MSTNEHERFIGGAMDKGIQLFSSAIDVNISWASDVFNVTSGIRQGVGPRYGISPLPGQFSAIAPASLQYNNLERSTGTAGSGLTYRQKIYAIYHSAQMGGWYAVIGVFRDSKLSFDVVFTAYETGTPSGYTYPLASFVGGWSQSGYVNRPDTGTPTPAYRIGEYLTWPKAPMYRTEFQNYFTLTNNNTVSSAYFNITGKDIPYQWMLGVQTTVPTATTTPGVGFGVTSFPTGGGNVASLNILLGVSTRFNVLEQRVKGTPRAITFYCKNDAGSPTITYQAHVDDTFLSAASGLGSTQVYAPITSGVTKYGGTGYSGVTAALVHDTGMTTRSRRDVVMVCGATPLAVIFQEGVNNPTGPAPRYFDLTSTAVKLREISTNDNNQLIGPISLVNSGYSDVFGTADPAVGVFRKDTVYEIGVALYNKVLDYETNVGVAGVTSAYLGDDIPATYSMQNLIAYTYGSNWNGLRNADWSLPFDFAGETLPSLPDIIGLQGQGLCINDYSYRFYYRPSGVGEWLPLEEYDASYFWFYSTLTGENPGENTVISLGAAPVGRTVGGQPNGFQDYSPLPKLPYFQVLNFQQRAFWFEEGSFRFSGSTHEFHYPTRNIVNSATGAWRGAMVFTRQNDIAAQSVLIIFSEQASYIAQFTGNMSTQVVRVSAVEVGEFPVDGSDFDINVLSDLTSFSNNSAVLAEGEAFWWGPQGIVNFTGKGPPEVISVELESDNPDETIFNICDPAQAQAIRAVYAPLTSEVIWFYPPAVADADFPTHYLCFNTQSRQFMRGKLPCQIDHAQNVDVGGSSYAPKSEGSRVVLYGRTSTVATAQTAFLFDGKTAMADMEPGSIIGISAISAPSTGVRRLTFGSGSINLGTSGIVVGDYALISKVQNYAPLLTGTNDFIARIVDVNAAGPTIDIELPTGAEMDTTFTGTTITSFPLFHRAAAGAGLHGIPWRISTNFWLPNGLINSYVWEYIHFLFKYVGVPQPRDPFDPIYGRLAQVIFQNRTLVCDGPSTSILKLINNSSNHCQIHHRVLNENRSANGQALAMTFRGTAFGDPWTLEYLEAQCILEKGFTLKEFQQ